MSDTSPRESSESVTKCPHSVFSFSTRTRRLFGQIRSTIQPLAVWLVFLIVISGSVAAQSEVGDVYCGTGVETGIGIVFGAVAGLGLPATGFYVGRSGLSYMRAGGNPEKKNQAKERLVMSGIGFGIIVLALISPELIDKVGSQMGFGFSDCVRPF